METISARVVSVHVGADDELAKDERGSIDIALDGIIGDRHRSHQREAWAGNDKQPEGTVRRNERLWSAVSVEELAEISETLELAEPLTAAFVGANLCLEGVRELSRLPKGTLLKFPSGAELVVEEFNHPCHDMGTAIAESYATRSGKPIATTAFSKAAKLTRGVVGVVEVEGRINAGDEVTVQVYETPAWLVRSTD